MNPVDSVHVEEHKIYSTEIIEIGAVMLDDGFKEIDSFKKICKAEIQCQHFKHMQVAYWHT